jgi:ribonucleoside-diphosphate reductase alpha chain
VLKETILQPKFCRNAIDILEARYLERDAEGKISESPEKMLRRVAKAVASAEIKYSDQQTADFWAGAFYQIMALRDFLPNSPTLMNAGRKNGQLSACFVLPIADNLDSIFTTLKNATMVHQSGGGTGFNFSSLRPKGDRILTTGGVSSGPLSFIKIFDVATGAVKQGGRRRGANMGIMNISHPDIEAFICAKSGKDNLSNFNLSVWMNDDFINAVQEDRSWELVNPRNGAVTKRIPAKQLWSLIVGQAWENGEPGLLFASTINRHNPTPLLGVLQATNPCGEMPLLAYESCNLGSINLSHMLVEEKGGIGIDWGKLTKTIRTAIRFLDNVIDVNYYTLPEIEQQTRQTRKIGLGVMGWAEMLFLLKIPYASDEAVELAKQLMKFIQQKSRETSAQLARERGGFPAFRQSVYKEGPVLRNATCTSIAPTGTISILAGTSSSIEPVFALVYKRMGILDNKIQWEVNPIFQKAMREKGLWSEKIKQTIYKCGTLKDITGLPNEFKEVFQTSHDIPWTYHVQHQVAFQRYTNNAVSKTINLSAEATKKDVNDAFMAAWKCGAKGITVYRYGSRNHQVLQTGKKVC